MRNRPITATGLIALALMLVAAPFGPRAAAADPPLCGSMAGAAPHITKVLWIVMENQSYGSGASQIPGSASDPYIKNTLSAQCGSASNFHATTHPSYPNYLALTSGSAQNHYSDSLGYFTGPSIFSQVDPSWRGYEEFMPSNCDHVFQTGTAPASQYYLGRHNPAASYSSMPIGAPSSGDCTTNDVSMGTTTAGALHDDAANGSLPSFSMVTPGLCDDMHGLPAGDTSCPDLIKGGDNWLASWIPILAASPDYTSGHLLIDVVWDEGHGGSDGDDCITMAVTSCIVPNIVISPYTTPVVATADYSHYSLLKTTEELLGAPLLGHAADPTTADLCGPYGICPAPDQPPAASFTASCNGLSCHFDGSASTASGGPIASYDWTYGDAATDAGVTVDHDYATAGSYPVSLTVTDATGRVATTTQQLSVSDVTTAPIGFVAATGAAGSTASPSVTVPNDVGPGDVMVLTAAAATTGPPTAPAGWTRVGDQAGSVMGTSVWTKVATAGDPGHAMSVTYPAAVKSTLQLAAYSGVDPDAPVAAFAAGGSHVTTSSASTPGVTVPAAGDWVVSSWSVKSSTVTAWRPPAGAPTRTTVIGTGGGRISSLVTDPGGPAAAGPIGGVGASTDQPFAAAVTTSLVLAQAACATGCTPPPPPPPPVAAFTASCTGWSCSFDASASTATAGSITGYAWSFGDGATGSGISPSHVYTADGGYPVSLTVTDTGGGQASVTHTETVAAAPPPPPPIGFVAAAGTTKNSATETVTVPAAVTAGNGLVLVATGVSTGTLSAPAGWRPEKIQPNAVMATSVWSKVATGSDARSPVTVTFPGQVKGSLQLLAYSGTSLGDPVAAVSAATSRSTTTIAVTPSVGVPGGGWLVSYWAAKSSAVSGWTPAAATARNSAIGTGGGQISALVADSNGALPAGNAGGLSATANQPFGSAVTLSIALAPLG